MLLVRFFFLFYRTATFLLLYAWVQQRQADSERERAEVEKRSFIGFELLAQREEEERKKWKEGIVLTKQVVLKSLKETKARCPM